MGGIESGGLSSRDQVGAVQEAETLTSEMQRYSVALRSPLFDVVSSVLSSASAEVDANVAAPDDGLVKDLASRFTAAQGQLEGYDKVSVLQDLKVDLNQREVDRILTLLRDESFRNGAGAPVQVVAEVSRAFSKAKKKARPGILRRIVDKIKTRGSGISDPEKMYAPRNSRSLNRGQAEPGKES